MSSAAPALLETRALSCTCDGGALLRDINVAIDPETFNVLTGPEGCGKNLLLRVLGLLERPASGELLVHGNPTAAWSDGVRSETRNLLFGYVFGAPFLLANFSVIENVAMPLFRISRVNPVDARRRSETVLEFVGLAAASQAAANDLSPAEQRRVSLARALANQPIALFVEEVDGETSSDEAAAFNALLRRARTHFSTAVIVTATRQFVVESDERRIELDSGTVAHDSRCAGNVGA